MRSRLKSVLSALYWVVIGFWSLMAILDALLSHLFGYAHFIHPWDMLMMGAISVLLLAINASRRKWMALAFLATWWMVDIIPNAALLSIAVGFFLWKHRADKSSPQQAITVGYRPITHWPIQIHSRDRFMHMHIIGPTGSGKSSSILMPLIRQDLEAKRGITLIEPKGDLSYTAYQTALSCHATLIYFDPHKPNCAHYNPLKGPADVAAEGLSWALNQITEAGHPFYAVTSRVLLMYSVMAVKEALGDAADLHHVLDFLRAESFREDVLAQTEDVRILAYFREQMKQIGARTAQEQRQGLLNRLELLLVNPDVRRVLSGPGDFDWDSVLKDDISVICPLSLARLGESAKVLGTLLWHGLAMATYRRLKASTVHPYFLYLDEFHQYVTPDLGDYLALARGYSVGIVLSHQDLGQLTRPLKEALLANARQRIIFGGIHADDAAIFSRLAQPYDLPPDLRYLPRGTAYAQLTQNGRLQSPKRLQLSHIPLAEERVHP
ncbi:MAG: conjugal transfer protein TraG [Sulfobacillus thermosulfidooxidans]|uniref:Conjugal transfer protein TraG n=1 Tax=Sulfobacillus thermosulfidooxidans TaxID=28034 RepID=A0A2T2WMG6_SULTH|nr:MAG: conjugal transfer protein TraG [Sulfobacillus thermosulfidooxidans]